MRFTQSPDPRFLMMCAQCLLHTAYLVKGGKYKSARQFVDQYLRRTAPGVKAVDSDVVSPSVVPES
jgi:hypothetical protein